MEQPPSFKTDHNMETLGKPHFIANLITNLPNYFRRFNNGGNLSIDHPHADIMGAHLVCFPGSLDGSVANSPVSHFNKYPFIPVAYRAFCITSGCSSVYQSNLAGKEAKGRPRPTKSGPTRLIKLSTLWIDHSSHQMGTKSCKLSPFPSRKTNEGE